MKYHRIMIFGRPGVGNNNLSIDNLTELVSFTVPENIRSSKLMESLGFKNEPENDFPHPKIPAAHKFSWHVFGQA